MFQDVQTTWWVLLAGFGVAMVVSFIWILLLRFISSFMIWFSLVAFIALSGFGELIFVAAGYLINLVNNSLSFTLL